MAKLAVNCTRIFPKLNITAGDGSRDVVICSRCCDLKNAPDWEREDALKLRLELFVADVQTSIEFYRRVLNFQVAGEVGKE